jgi:hypothetical protein
MELVPAFDGHIKRGLSRGKLRANVRTESPRLLEFVLSKFA